MLEDLPVPASPKSRQLLAFLASYKCFRVLDQFLLRDLISNQIIKTYMGEFW